MCAVFLWVADLGGPVWTITLQLTPPAVIKRTPSAKCHAAVMHKDDAAGQKGKEKGGKKTKTIGPQAWGAWDNNGLRKLRGFEMQNGRKGGGKTSDLRAIKQES